MSEDTVWTFRIAHILQAINEIENFVSGVDYEDFIADAKTLRAVERNIEIIGEAASKIPKDIQQKYPHIPWGGMKGMRNAVSHGYDQVEYESVWDVVKDKLPDLKVMLLSIEINKTDAG